MLNTPIATCRIVGISPLSQSRQHNAPKLGQKESPDDYDTRTWRSKMTVTEDGKSVGLNTFGMQQCIVSAAKYSRRKIAGAGNNTWTAKFSAGIMIPNMPSLNIDPEKVDCIYISVNSDGKRGSGTRVSKHFPQMPAWETTFDVYILDEEITEDIFREMLEIAGMFVGVGQFRPQNGGTNGRFSVQSIAWQDNRRLAA